MTDNTSEFYSPRNTLPVKAGTSTNYAGQAPLVDTEPVVAVRPQLGEKGSYWIISPKAGRTIEDSRIGKKVVWGGDLPGDIYGDRDQKGGRFEKIFTVTSDAYGEWRVKGLLPYIPQAIDREETASVLFRQAGLPTDVTRAIHLIKELPDAGGKYFGMEKWKSYAIQKLNGKLANDPDRRSKLASAKKWLSGQEFCIEVRDLQVAERLREIGLCQTSSEFEFMIRPIFKWVNAATDAKKSGLISGTPQPEHFEYTTQDIKRYFGEWLPEQMGIYIARLRNNHLTHSNTTAQNWSAAGTLYDKDTVVGVPLGDKPPTIAQYKNDMTETLGALDELMAPEEGNYISRVFGKELLLTAKASLLKGYLLERHGKGDVNSGIIKSILSDYKYYNGKKDVEVKISEEDWKFMENLGLRTRSV